MAILCRKLKLVKTNLISLNKSHGNLHSLVKCTRAQAEVHASLPLDHLNYDLLVEEKALILNKVLVMEESLLKQKSQVKLFYNFNNPLNKVLKQKSQVKLLISLKLSVNDYMPLVQKITATS